MAPEGYPFGRLFCVSLPNRLDFLSFALLFPYFAVNLWQFRHHSWQKVDERTGAEIPGEDITDGADDNTGGSGTTPGGELEG